MFRWLLYRLMRPFGGSGQIGGTVCAEASVVDAVDAECFTAASVDADCETGEMVLAECHLEDC